MTEAQLAKSKAEVDRFNNELWRLELEVHRIEIQEWQRLQTLCPFIAKTHTVAEAANECYSCRTNPCKAKGENLV
jgi:hypothetical protein